MSDDDLNPYEWQYVCCGKMPFRHPTELNKMRFCTVCHKFWLDDKIATCNVKNWIDYAAAHSNFIPIHNND
jgi:hypothetical protein